MEVDMAAPGRVLQRCVQCGQELVAPEWSEYITQGQVCHSWRCGCGCAFETSVDSLGDAKLDMEVIEQFLPSLLVA